MSTITSLFFTTARYTLKESHERFDAVIYAYCLMGNHYHLFIETPGANFDRIMQRINGVYTQSITGKENGWPVISVALQSDTPLMSMLTY